MQNLKKLLPGTFLVLIISLTSIFLNNLLKSKINLEALTIAIVLGIVYNNTLGSKKIVRDGIKFSLTKLLKLGIILLGFKLNIHAILKLGPKMLMTVVIFVPLALIFAIFLGKWFKVDKKLSTLIGVGSCICGASAIVAMAPCIDADDEDSVIAVSIISFLGAIGVIVYSGIAAGEFSFTATQYGAWSGLSLQGVAHAVAAAFAMGNVAGETGTFVKMTRVLMLVPVSIVLAYLFRPGKNTKTSQNRVKFPMYVFYFILAGVINSINLIPSSITGILADTSTFLILMAMTAMGLSVNFKSILDKGIKALGTGSLLFIILSGISLIAILNII